MNQQSFTHKIRGILQDNAGIRPKLAQKSGKWLDGSRLGLIPAGSRRIFASTERRQNWLYHFLIALDVSGSMHGNALKLAGKALHALSYALEVSGALFEAISFNAKVRPIEHAREPGKLSLELHKHCMAGSAYNCDHKAVDEGMRRLLQSYAPARILLVMSDGQPACECNLGGLDCSEALSASIKRAEACGITPLGLGILTDAPKEYYGAKNSEVVNSLSELYPATLSLLSRFIKRG